MLVDMIPFSAVDYPGKIAATLFYSGCNFRCGFCHNASLVKNEVRAQVTQDDVLSFLSFRKGLLDGVCITGGEALLSVDLFEILPRIKELGYTIKLDTNGSNLELLQKASPYLEFVAIDLKATPGEYDLITGKKGAWQRVQNTLAWLKDSGLAYELRTTVLPEWHNESSLKSMRSMVRGPWVLQQFKQPQGGVLDGKVHQGYPDKELLRISKELGCKVRNV